MSPWDPEQVRFFAKQIAESAEGKGLVGVPGESVVDRMLTPC